MTIKYTRFWLEPYDIFYMDVGIFCHSYEMVKCKKCIEKSESEDKK